MWLPVDYLQRNRLKSHEMDEVVHDVEDGRLVPGRGVLVTELVPGCGALVVEDSRLVAELVPGRGALVEGGRLVPGRGVVPGSGVTCR